MTRPSSRFTLMLACLVTGACHDQITPVSPARSSLAAHTVIAAVQLATPDRSDEVEFVRLATNASSSAAYYIDDAGVFTVWVRDSIDDGKAITAARALLPALRPTFGRPVSGPVIRRAQFTFAQLAAWRDALFANALNRIDGVTMLDLNEATNRVVVGLDQRFGQSLRGTVLQLLPKLGIDSNAVVFVTRKTASANGRMLKNARYGYSLTSAVDTMVGGLNYIYKWASNPANGGGCTIGTIVDYGGSPAMLSASHCSENSFVPNGDVAYQSYATDPRFAHETVDAAGYTCGLRTCRGSDANIWPLDAGVKSLQGLIAKTTSSTSTWGTAGSIIWNSSDPYFITIAYVASITSGAAIQKMGAATGYTTGFVTGTCVDIQVPHTRSITCMTETSTYVDLGDSGGPFFVLSGNGSYVYLAGITGAIDPGAMRSYYSPVTRIATDLGAMNVMRPITLSGLHPIL
jgi:hypothetical protein